MATVFAASQCTVRAAASSEGPAKRNVKRKGVVSRAQNKPKSEEPASIVFNTPALTNGAPVLEKTETKAPSPSINIISPVSQWPTGIPPAMGGHYMCSGILAPLSNSKGPGIDIAPQYFTYPAGESEIDVIVHDNEFSAANGLADTIARASAASIAAKGSFTVALSGGSLVKALEGLIGRSDIDFTRWYVFFVDERVVPLSSPDSNYAAAQEALLRKVPIPASHIIPIKEGLSASQAAEHYAGRMLDLPESVLPRTASGFPVLDLVLLGVGPDGHVASLFPNRKETAATSGWVLAVTDSPKPPSERITMTMPVINAAARVAVVALGAGKAEVVQRALEVQSLPGALPVQLVQPAAGNVTWIVDKAAAGDLQVADWDNAKKFPRST